MSSSFSVDKKLNDQFHRNAKIQKIASKEAKRNLQYLENEPDGYMIPENEIDKTLKVSQDYLKSILPKYNADNIFDLNLEDKAPFYIDYSRNGKYLLLAGEKGNISMLDWRDKNLITEFDTDSTISNIKFLHNETMFAVAQNDMVYIYDGNNKKVYGISLRGIKYIGKDPKNFLSMLHKCKRAKFIEIGDELSWETKNSLRNNQYIIPYLYS